MILAYTSIHTCAECYNVLNYAASFIILLHVYKCEQFDKNKVKYRTLNSCLNIYSFFYLKLHAREHLLICRQYQPVNVLAFMQNLITCKINRLINMQIYIKIQIYINVQ